MVRSLLVLLISAVVGIGAGLSVTGSAGRVDVNVVRRVDLGYHLVTGDRELEFEVEGPAWLRVYTRVWWPPGAGGTRTYNLSLWQDDVERPLDFEAGRSKSSWSGNRHPVGKWRSFYIQVPAGASAYRLVLNEAPLDTVAVRFSFQKPRPWEPVGLSGFDRLELAIGVKRETFYRAAVGSQSGSAFTVSGPCRVRLRFRLNFDPDMVGSQNFVATLTKDGRELVGENFRVSRDRVGTWDNAPDIVPSTERTARFSLGEGMHRLHLVVRGTLARSCGFRVERIASEKYE